MYLTNTNWEAEVESVPLKMSTIRQNTVKQSDKIFNWKFKVFAAVAAVLQIWDLCLNGIFQREEEGTAQIGETNTNG